MFFGNFILQLVLLLVIVLVILSAANYLLRKWLKVEKRSAFSYDYVNDRHKKLDRFIRIAAIIVIFVSYIITISRGPEAGWFIPIPVILLSFLVVSESVRAVMEKKYAENKNDYVYTIAQMIIITSLLIVIFWTDFFGIFTW